MSERLERVDIICGGFPCQDISLAGDGAGLSGERSGLWRPMVHAVRVVRPQHAVVENVAALLDRGMGEVLGDLAESGYDSEWCCLPTGRPLGHNRERVFIVADDVRQRLQERRDSNQVGTNAPRIFTGERPSGVLEGVDAGERWADRPLLGRGVHGIPSRAHRIRALGNSVVPQVAEWIFRRIAEAEGIDEEVTSQRGGPSIPANTHP